MSGSSPPTPLIDDPVCPEIISDLEDESGYATSNSNRQFKSDTMDELDKSTQEISLEEDDSIKSTLKVESEPEKQVNTISSIIFFLI